MADTMAETMDDWKADDLVYYLVEMKVGCWVVH